jgi:hypothetical protein
VRRQPLKLEKYKRNVLLKMTVFWDVVKNLVVFDRRFKGAYCHHREGDRPDGGSSN